MALIIVVLVFAVGWFVFKQNDTSDINDFATAPVREQLVINEWGVAFDQPSPDATLSYKLDDVNADGAQSAHLVYEELTAIGSLCKDTELATIVKLTPGSYYTLPGNERMTVRDIESNPELAAIVFPDNGTFNKVGENYYYLANHYGDVPVCGGKEAKNYIDNFIASEDAVDLGEVWAQTFTAAENVE